jgi:hypothetical protein
MRVTVVGGGLGGMVAAATAAEAGVDVTLYEARDRLGGRARSTAGEFVANWGPHVVYTDGALWAWLIERGLHRPYRRPPAVAGWRFRWDGRARRRPPKGLVGAVWRLRRVPAGRVPVDAPFRDWAAGLVGDEAAGWAARAMGVATFDADPGRLSAAFVQERLRRVTAVPPAARYLVGGWGAMVERVAAYARARGVRVETGSPVDALPDAPVVLAVPLPAAARLLGDPGLRWEGARTALLDLGVSARRGDPFVVSDLDECGWVEAYSIADRTLAPAGHHLLQAQIGLQPDESLDDGVRRIETLLDLTYEGWRGRERWRRRARVEGESGALDLPGTSWRDRPAIDRGGGVYLVGDMVAAPGVLSEVSVASALEAVRLLTGTRQPAGLRPGRHGVVTM